MKAFLEEVSGIFILRLRPENRRDEEMLTKLKRPDKEISFCVGKTTVAKDFVIHIKSEFKKM